MLRVLYPVCSVWCALFFVRCVECGVWFVSGLWSAACDLCARQCGFSLCLYEFAFVSCVSCQTQVEPKSGFSTPTYAFQPSFFLTYTKAHETVHNRYFGSTLCESRSRLCSTAFGTSAAERRSLLPVPRTSHVGHEDTRSLT